MDSGILIDSFADFARGKNIDRPTMIRILEDVFRTMIRKKYKVDDNFDIIINTDKGDLEIWRFREIVDDNSEDIWDHDKISLTEARKTEPDFEIGEEVAEEIKLIDFGSAYYSKCGLKHNITTRQYRAPEVICLLNWGYATDYWSLG